jgi:hypothetical protein
MRYARIGIGICWDLDSDILGLGLRYAGIGIEICLRLGLGYAGIGIVI